MVDAVDGGLALRHQAGDDERHRGPEIRGYHLRARSVSTPRTGGVALQLDVGAEAAARKREAMVQDLRGMFAFAIWDAERRTLLLARDPYGINHPERLEDRQRTPDMGRARAAARRRSATSQTAPLKPSVERLFADGVPLRHRRHPVSIRLPKYRYSLFVREP